MGMPMSARLLDLGSADANDPARLAGMVMALAGEVFVLKAEVQRLRHALAAQGTLGVDALDAAGRSPEIAAWMASEQNAFARSLLDPFVHPDQAPDVTRFMQEK